MTIVADQASTGILAIQVHQSRSRCVRHRARAERSVNRSGRPSAAPCERWQLRETPMHNVFGDQAGILAPPFATCCRRRYLLARAGRLPVRKHHAKL